MQLIFQARQNAIKMQVAYELSSYATCIFIAFISLVMLPQIARDEQPLPKIEKVGPLRVW